MKIRIAFFLWLLFSATDVCLFYSLPRLGLSFGRHTIATPAWLTMRIFLLVVLLAVVQSVKCRRIERKACLGVFALFILFNISLSGLLVDGFYVEPFRLTVTHLERRMPGLAAGESIRVVHLTDLHMERITRRERDLIETVNNLHPDLILMTGDYINLSSRHDPQADVELRTLVSRLEADEGIYAINGNVYNPEKVKALFGGLDVTVLNDEIHWLETTAGTVTLVGVSHHNWIHDEEVLQSLMAQVPAEEYSILLYHMPDIIETAAESGVDFYLAGHTHGGQIRLPIYGAVITLSRYGKRYEMGLYRVEDTELYVSRGVGMEGDPAPRARFLCPPEIVVIDFHR